MSAIVVDCYGVIWVQCAHIDCFVVRLDLSWNRLVLCIFLVKNRRRRCALTTQDYPFDLQLTATLPDHLSD